MSPLAELEVWHSRPIAPTRRVALGFSTLPTDPAPGFGGILLGGVVAANAAALDEDDHDDVERLLRDIEKGRSIKQPRLRHRFQVDRIGLMRSVHRLVGDGERLGFDLASDAPPVPQILAAIYETAKLTPNQRTNVISLIRRSLVWSGGDGPELVRFLTGQQGATGMLVATIADPVGWARDVLGLDGVPSRKDVVRRFRELVVEAHPDHGGVGDDAAERIDELTRAREILLSA
ncbi:MAG: J domain-containing protein [Actinomycetota bacterium]